MFKFLIFIIALNILLLANDKVEIYATKMDSKNNIVNAYGDVTVVYKDYYITASKAIYDKDSGELELFDNVRANQKNEYKLLGNYAKLNIKTKEKTFKPFYMLEKESQVWLSADEGCLNDKELDLESGVVSGCDPLDPLWKMEFTSSDYDLDSKWLNLYNTRFYIYDIPVFYTPWFGYPLDKTRRTGLLQPSFGYSGTEGLYYEQPIYIAEYDSWDLEFKPQIRTNRGKGLYTTFRFVDSPFSKGSITVGSFKENKDYFNQNDLANDDHHGFNFKYKNNNVLNQWFGLNLDGQSGLYADISSMNDVDYINLSKNTTLDTSTATQVLSRVNMFYNTQDNYFGTYFKYYQDLTAENNDETLQQIPTLHYHHYLETLLDEHLLYNIDIQSTNKHKKVGKKVTQTDLNIPITLQTSFFDEYLNISYVANLYAQHSAFSGRERVQTTDKYEDGYIARNSNVISASTQVTKAFTDFTHVMGLSSSYTFKGSETRDGFYSDNEDLCQNSLTNSDPRCEYYVISQVQEKAQFDFTQFIYDSKGRQKLYHRLSQAILYTDKGTKSGDLENELDLMVTDAIFFYNNIFYNYKNNKPSKIYTKISYRDYGFDVSLANLYKNTFLPQTQHYTPYTNYLTSAVSYQYSTHWKYNVAYDYDLELKVKKRQEIGFLYSKRCWDFGIRYVENNRPVLSNNGMIRNIYDRYIYFTVSLKPFMSSSSASELFAYKIPGNDKQ